MEGALKWARMVPNIFVFKKLPMVWQAEAGECGLACLSMVLSQLGSHQTLRQLRARYSTLGRGATLQHLKGIACDFGCAAKIYRVALKDLHKLSPGLILHWDFNHFVVFGGCRFGRYLIHDPAQGKRWLAEEEVSRHFTGVAMYIEAKALKSLPKEADWGLLAMLKTSSAIFQLGMTSVLSIVLQLCMLATPIYLQTVIDDVVLRMDATLLMSLAMGFGLLLLFQSLCNFVRDDLVIRFSARVNQQMAEDLFNHLLVLPLKFFHARHIGDVQSRFNSLDYFRHILSQSLAVSVVDGILALLTLLAMAIYSQLLAGIVVAMMAVYIVLVVGLSSFVRDAQQNYVQRRADQDSHFIESLKSISTLKQNRWLTLRVEDWLEKLSLSVRADVNAKRRQLFLESVLRFLQGVEHIVLVYFAAFEVMEGRLTVGMLFAFMAYKGRFASSLQALVNVLIELRLLPLHKDRVNDILLADADNYTNKHCTISSDLLLQVDELVLPNSPRRCFYLRLHAHECLAITGTSGCGKSTFLRSLLGLESKQGDIEWHVDRDDIAAVLQEDCVLSGSVVDNIVGFKTPEDTQWLQKVITIAGLQDLMQRLPMGLDTAIGEQGAPISAGQTQRILLARALYKKPKVLLLDEATSHLDVSAEKTIMAALKALPISILMVAHRPDCLSFADRYYSLDGATASQITS